MVHRGRSCLRGQSGGGAVIAYVPGVWDLLHVGHVSYLELAARYGDVYVGVAADKVVEEDKGEPPIIPEEDRVRMVRSLRCVKQAEIYRDLGFLAELNELQPTTFITSPSWTLSDRHHRAFAWCKMHKCYVQEIPYTDGVSTSEIRAEVVRREL